VLRQAWDSPTAEQAERLLRNLARRLDHDAPGVSASILEGLDEMLTAIRLGLPNELRRSLGCTNAIESLIAVLRQGCRNVKRWRDARMALRWTATAMPEAEKSFPLEGLQATPGSKIRLAASSARLARRATHCQQKPGRIAFSTTAPTALSHCSHRAKGHINGRGSNRHWIKIEWQLPSGRIDVIMADVPTLIFKSAKTSRPSGIWSDDDYDVLSEGKVVGRIFKDDGQQGRPWFWGITHGCIEDRAPTHGHEPTREAAMAAFRKSWLRE